MFSENENTEFTNQITLEDLEYQRLSNFIVSQFGIKLPPSKKTLLQCRLQKRLKTLQHNNFKDYVKYVFSSDGLKEELPKMIDAISTNKTDFFRESVHFDFLSDFGIADYIKRTEKKKLNIWSAGCSSGEEPYTIAMVMEEYISNNPLIDYNILATDISNSVLKHAMVGIYSEEKTRPIPFYMRKKYLLRGKNEYENKVRIIPQLRAKIEFQKFNLLTADYALFGKFDLIFCRNVLIYFERDVQLRLLQQFCKRLNYGGYLFLGHSESITGSSIPLKRVRPTIFTKEI